MQNESTLNWSVSIRPAKQWGIMGMLAVVAFAIGLVAFAVLALFSALQGSYGGISFAAVFSALLACGLTLALIVGYLAIYALPGRGWLSLEYRIDAHSISQTQHTRRSRTAGINLEDIISVRNLRGGRLKLSAKHREMIVFAPDDIRAELRRRLSSAE